MDGLGFTFSWLDLKAFIRRLPRTSQTVQDIHGPAWSNTDLLLAQALDVLRVGNWQRQGKKGAPRPKPTPIPGVTPGEKKYGKATDARSVKSWLEQRNGRAPDLR